MKVINSTEQKVLKLAKKAGFVLWNKCDWAGDRVGKVDWACEYDEELIKFYQLVRKEVEDEYASRARNY